MRFGLMTFPGLFNNFYSSNPTKLTQRLEPSVLYVAPQQGESAFLLENQPRDNVDLYLCSVYTRGWNEFREFAQKVGRDKVIAGGYHPTALPEEALKHAHKVVPGYCRNIDDVINGPEGIIKAEFGFTPMRRDLINLQSMRQVYPDINPEDISGSMVSSVGCPYDCDFCSTPGMSGRKMRVSDLEYVEGEIDDLVKKGATTVFIRDESFATNPKIKDFAPLFKDKFKILYSFGTGAVIAKRPDILESLMENGWHSLNFGLEDVGISYRKNTNLHQAVENCRKAGMKYVMSFIVNDDGKSREEAQANYQALFDAFVDLKPSQVCANFLMPFPGTKLWGSYQDRIREKDFDKFDSKTPVFTNGSFGEWHKRMLVAVQLKYYKSEVYNREVRQFDIGDNLNLRMLELEREYGLTDVKWEELLRLN